MANRWGNNGNSDRLYFWLSKITSDGDCSHEIKRRLLLGRKVMTNLDSVLKSRDIERTDAEAEFPIFWRPEVKNRFIGKDLDSGKD